MPEIRSIGPKSYEVNVAVSRGQLVEPDGTTGKIKPATLDSAVVLGCARDDAAPAGSGASSDFGTLRPRTSVFGTGFEVELTVAADTDFGEKVKAAANGQVTPIGVAAAADARQIVARCVEPAGVLSGAKGKFLLV